MPDMQCYFLDRALELVEGNLWLLSIEASVRVFHEFMRFVHQQQSESGTDNLFVECTTVTLT